MNSDDKDWENKHYITCLDALLHYESSLLETFLDPHTQYTKDQYLTLYNKYLGVKQAWFDMSESYIRFRIQEFDSEGRKVINQVYKSLGYDPRRRRC